MANWRYSNKSKAKKKKVETDWGEAVLKVGIRYAEGIDIKTMDPGGDKRLYQIFGWIMPESEFITRVAEGLPNPVWNMEHTVSMENPITFGCSYLHLEVYRVRSKSDPGTSAGHVMVGRTRIPLPNRFNIRRTQRYGLVMPGGFGEFAKGHIAVTTELKIEDMDVYIP